LNKDGLTVKKNMNKQEAKILPVRIYGDETLWKISEPIDEITDEISQFIEGLIKTMYEKDGVGLAAPQVGRALRLFVVDPYWFREGNEKKPFVFINPEFVEFEGTQTNEEGCLSLPGIYEKVNRAERVIINALNEKGEEIQLETDGLFSRALQHENDHLDGILFVDKVHKMRKILIKKKLRELESTTDENGVNIREE